MRHFIEYVFVTIQKAYLEPQDQIGVINNFEQALHEIRNIALDHSQYIA